MLKCCELPEASLATFATYLPPTSAASRPGWKLVRFATVSMAERVFRDGPTRMPTWASVTVCLLLLVTEPETVIVSPSVGVLGLSESRLMSTVPDPVASATEARSAA